MVIEGVVKDNMDFSWKHVGVVVLAGLVAVSLIRRNFLGIQNALDGLAGMSDQPVTNAQN